MNRVIMIFAALAIVVVGGMVMLAKTGKIDVAQRKTSIPAGAIPHGGKEKPVGELATTGSAK